MTVRRVFTILNFIEEAMNETLQHASSANRAKIAKSQMKVIAWLEKARAATREFHGDYQEILPTPYFPKAPKTETTIINAALALAEDVWFYMRTKKMMCTKEMKSAWNRMIAALVSLFSHYDPDWEDCAGQVTGLALARKAWNSASRRP